VVRILVVAEVLLARVLLGDDLFKVLDNVGERRRVDGEQGRAARLERVGEDAVDVIDDGAGGGVSGVLKRSGSTNRVEGGGSDRMT
jgi:hypothetical protein